MFVSTFSISQNPTVISDSLVIMNRVYAKEKLIVDQEAKFKQDIKVLGTARMKADIVVDGTAKFNGNVKMDSLGGIPNSIMDAGTMQFLVVLPNGQVKKGTVGDLIEIIYKKPDVSYLCESPNPYWASEINKLFSKCPNVFVGIGNDNPQHQLHVSGVSFAHKFLAGKVQGSNSALFNGYSLNATDELMSLGVQMGTSPAIVRFTVANDGGVQIKSGGTTPALRINNGLGHALIVHANNGDKILQLEDNGLLRARRIKVDEDTWADHVFDKNYKLPKLNYVAKFIDKNHHLPGVPSAEEIKRDGLDIGEMQTIQMQKIEELTLYLIEMDEKMRIMEKRMNELESENAKLIRIEK